MKTDPPKLTNESYIQATEGIIGVDPKSESHHEIQANLGDTMTDIYSVPVQFNDSQADPCESKTVEGK